jgi:hypothetical protein
MHLLLFFAGGGVAADAAGSLCPDRLEIYLAGSRQSALFAAGAAASHVDC